MNPRTTLIVVAIFALLLGYVFMVEVNKTPEQLGTPVPTPQTQVFSLHAENVKTIEIRDLRVPRQVRMTRAFKDWKIEQPIEKEADSPKVDGTISQLVTLKANRVLTSTTDLGRYGLVTATLEARLVMTDGVPYALTIGDKTPDSSSYYAVYTGDKSKVFLIGSAVVNDLLAWLDNPPVAPTPTPTYTPTIPPTATPEGTPAATDTPPAATPTP